MRIELTRFRVKEGKHTKVDEWMNMLNARMEEVIASLKREHMLIEVIFREKIDDQEYLSWFSVQDESGETVETSTLDVDKEHLEFWRECIDQEYGGRDATPQVVMVMSHIAKAMKWGKP